MGSGVENKNYKKVPEKLGEEHKQKNCNGPPVYVHFNQIILWRKWQLSDDNK